MRKRKPIENRFQDATEPLDDFDRLARKRLGLPPREKLVNPSRRRWLPPLLLLILAACLIGYSFYLWRGRTVTALTPSRSLTVAFLDVGQGDSTLIQTSSGKNILIDTGPPTSAGALFADLGQRGVTHLDKLIITHPEEDHYGNSAAVLSHFPTKTIVESGFPKPNVMPSKIQTALTKEIARQNIPLIYFAQKQLAGTTEDLGDGVTLSYLAPLAYSSKTNNNSIILKVSLGHVSVLCMGDAEVEERTALLAREQNVQATILKVAHHGSRNGTDAVFLARVHPEVAVISCGLDNRHDHPNPATLDALHQAGIRVLQTYLQGTIFLQTDGKSYKVSPVPK